MSDIEFAARLHSATDRYLRSVDAWEEQYRKYYRLATTGVVRDELEAQQKEFVQARRELEQFVPRARMLCQRYDVRDPWPGLLRVTLGAQTPQAGGGSAVGKGERMVISECLLRIEAEASMPPVTPTETTPQRSRGLARRILELFS